MELWFGEEKVDVIRHDDVAEEEELVTLAKLFEGFFEDDAGVVVVEIGEPVVAAEVDGVVVALLLIALQTARHEGYGTSGSRLPVVVWVVQEWGLGWLGLYLPTHTHRARMNGHPGLLVMEEMVGGPPAVVY